ncbi:hypothetical protein D3C87_2020830 [compost metagenome]
MILVEITELEDFLQCILITLILKSFQYMLEADNTAEQLRRCSDIPFKSFDQITAGIPGVL